MHFLITGHTGFKGTWLTLLLKELGHEVSGISLAPEKKSLFNQAEVSDLIKFDIRCNVLDARKIQKCVSRIKPDVIIHLAAQSLVGESYRNPIQTFNTNIMGTLNILESSNCADSIKAILIVTSDKVYKNSGDNHYFTETDPLGGIDPYSGSKAAADIAAQSWIKSFGKVPTAIARAGNVIGGGDWAKGRLVPDVVTNLQNGTILRLRYPNAVRPWQHVLECLNGYLHLVSKQLTEKVGGEWNFGPTSKQPINVEQFVESFSMQWGSRSRWNQDSANIQSESTYLLLDSSNARKQLEWKEKMGFEQSVNMCVEWYKNYGNENPRDLTVRQIKNFLLMK